MCRRLQGKCINKMIQKFDFNSIYSLYAMSKLVIKNNGEANWLLATLYFNAIEIKVLGGLKH